MFLGEPPESAARDAVYADDVDKEGFVWTLTRLWAWNRDADELFGELLDKVTADGGLSFRDKAMLVTATARTIDNSGCALAWGNRLALATDVDTAVGVLHGEENDAMTYRDRTLTRWARKVADDPTTTGPKDIAELRALGLDDKEIFSLTLYVALRIAYSTFNDALGVPLDQQEVDKYPDEVVAAVDFGRPPA